MTFQYTDHGHDEIIASTLTGSCENDECLGGVGIRAGGGVIVHLPREKWLALVAHVATDAPPAQQLEMPESMIGAPAPGTIIEYNIGGESARIATSRELFAGEITSLIDALRRDSLDIDEPGDLEPETIGHALGLVDALRKMAGDVDADVETLGAWVANLTVQQQVARHALGRAGFGPETTVGQALERYTMLVAEAQQLRQTCAEGARHLSEPIRAELRAAGMADDVVALPQGVHVLRMMFEGATAQASELQREVAGLRGRAAGLEDTCAELRHQRDRLGGDVERIRVAAERVTPAELRGESAATVVEWMAEYIERLRELRRRDLQTAKERGEQVTELENRLAATIVKLATAREGLGELQAELEHGDTNTPRVEGITMRGDAVVALHSRIDELLEQTGFDEQQ